MDGTGCGRPALPFSNLSTISTNGVSGRGKDEILEVEYGYYPQTAVSKLLQNRLETALHAGFLNKTGNIYTTDSRKNDEYDSAFLAQEHIEYEYDGKKYVRVKANSYYDGEKFTLSNGEQYQDGDFVWIEVQPVKWLIDEKYKIMLMEKLIFAGVQFNRESDYKTKNFNTTDIKKFMNDYLSKDLFQHNELTFSNVVNTQSKETTTSYRKQNPYGFDFSEVSEEDIIKGSVEGGVTVFLHGRSSEGKSARVKQLDPNPEIVYLITANPDSFAGKSVYNQQTGEMMDIKPTWLKRLEEKCEKEPDKIHILFLDEISNVKSNYILNLAFNLVLDRELDGKWQLPENARVVVAGNEKCDSISATEIPQPLFNRMAHVFITTTVDGWLKWAATPKEEYERLDYKRTELESKIHPAIYAYVAYRGEEVLRTPYNGETPNADPRKWELASKVLYTTKNPNMLRALVGEEITKDFVKFCEQQVITIEDIVSNNYSDQGLQYMDISEKYATAVGLSFVTDENLEVVRNFITKLGPEIVATFDSLWVHGDDKRLERIAELRAEHLSMGGQKR